MPVLLRHAAAILLLGDTEPPVGPDGWTLDTSIEAAGAAHRAVAGAARLTLPGQLLGPEDGVELVSILTVEVYRPPDFDVPVVELDGSYGRRFDEVLNEPGSGRVVLDNDNPDLALIEQGDLIRFSMYGETAFEFVVEELEQVVLADGEEFAQVTTITGRGRMVLLERTVLYPANGIAAKPVERDHTFDFSSPYYDPVGWRVPQFIAGHNGGSAWGPTVPVGWPEGVEGGWLWAHAGSQIDAPPGYVPFRAPLTVPPGVSEIFVAACIDNEGRVRLDGQEFLKCKYRSTSTEIIEVTPGPHLVAVDAWNYPKPAGATAVEVRPFNYTVVSGDTLWGLALRYYKAGRFWRRIYDANQALIQADAETAGLWDPRDPGHWIFPGQVLVIPGLSAAVTGYQNPGGLKLEVYAAESGAPVGAPLLTTSDPDAWLMLEYPDTVPGMSAGEILLAMLEAGRLRGGLPWAATFTGVHDTAGQRWDLLPDFATKTGTDYVTIARELTGTYCDLWVEPGSLRISAWRPGTRGRTRALALAGADPLVGPSSGNIDAYTRTTF